MPRCKTNCVEKHISKGFEWLGRFIGRNPWYFLFLPLLISAGLGGGFYFLEERESNDIEDQFTPVNGPAKQERAIVQQNFQEDDEFSQLRLSTEGTFASLIIVMLQDKPLLTVESFTEILKLDKRVKDITSGTMSFENLCAKTNGMCMTNAILDIINYDASKIASITLTYPMYKHIYLGSGIGGVQLKPQTTEVESANAVRLFYFLKEDNRTANELWLHAFIENFSKSGDLERVSVTYFTSISRGQEFESNSKIAIPLFAITYVLAINISIILCLRLDCVRNKVWVASFGVLSSGLAVLSSFGLLLFSGVPFAMTVATAPFLILGIGVDDMFIMISSWQKTQVKDKPEDRLANTYKEAAVSITITTLTDIVAFYIGIMTPFRSVQSFCLYTGTAVLFCYIYNITFFGAFLVLNGKREESNRHWLTCKKVDKPNEEENPKKSNMCSVGGSFDPKTGTEEDMPIEVFFRDKYGPFLTNPWTKMFVTLVYAGYLATSIYGCFNIQEGIDLKNLATDGSYVGSYYDNEDKYFSEYGPNVMCVIADSGFQYWNTTAQKSLEGCLQNFHNLSMVSKSMTQSWLHSYLQYGTGMGFDLNNERGFKKNLQSFLQLSGFSQDVNFTDDNIYASRLFIQTVNIRSAVDEKDMLTALRDTAEKCRTSQNSIDLLVYHPSFIYFDQYTVIISNTIQNVAVATLAMLVISLLLIPNPLCCLWVTFAIASVIVGVAGFMALWDVNLDSISMINLVICIGFSVDFSAHISYAFVSSEKTSANEKAIDGLYKLGYPIIQGALSTVAGVVVLSAAKSYIFRTFFKIMFLVILFGAVHGIMFLPVFLTFFGICSTNSVKNENAKGSTRKNGLNANIHRDRDSIVTMEMKKDRIGGLPNVYFSNAIDPDCP